MRNDKGKYGYLNTQGKVTVPLKYANGGDFSDGVAPVQNTAGKWGYIDKNGKTVIPFKFSFAGSFSEGLAYVSNDRDQWGYINKAGTLVIPYRNFNRVYDFHNGVALVGNNKLTLIDGELRYLDTGFGYMDKRGNLLTKLEYSEISSSFSGGYAAGMKELGSGVILRVEDNK
ncbi:WG repeat-containing protein [Paenibacillus tepidiphilus]|uniref:WG repeat-containing protein n=1 Tax=Paenibacillus tepidiphilus TaxID=2608683 RepID=UPI001EF1379D|nr:WG repeat-containing protein [Paenibacillus tepidiphilus]